MSTFQFEPRKDGTLSVQNIDSLCKSEVVKADACVAKINKKTLYRWAKITRTKVEDIELSRCIDNHPWQGHAIISGWPRERNARLEKQKLLAAYSCGVLL